MSSKKHITFYFIISIVHTLFSTVYPDSDSDLDYGSHLKKLKLQTYNVPNFILPYSNNLVKKVC